MSSYVKQELAKTKKLFSLTGTLRSADVLGKTGNVIKAEENARVAEATARVQAVYDKLSLSAGPISDALNQAAEALAQGKQSPLEVKQHALERVRKAVRETFARSHPAGAEEAGAHIRAEREYMAQRRKQKPENSQQNLAEALNESDQASRKT